MSGLAAVFQRDGRPVGESAVWRMLRAVPYRGPDGMTVAVVDRVVALGHARMNVTYEDCVDQQPLLSPRTGCAIIADIRLDNRDELMGGLPALPGSAISDADLVLRGYDEWGAGVLDRLLGDFAFVIWD